MGFENQSSEEVHLYASKEEMESLVLDDDVRPPLSASPPFAEISTNDGSDGRDHNGNIHDPLLSSPSSIPQNHRQPQSQGQNPSPNPFILEPPSYADAVFRSFDASSENNGQDLSTSSPASSSSPSFSDYLIISVSDPQKEQDISNSLVPGGSTYFSYLITTRTNFPEFSGTEFSVRRRFRDVVTLSDRLAEAYRGFFIPIRPDKSVVEGQVMQKQEFVEQRRLALERYLRKLAKHPAICRSEELRLFLEAEGRLPLAKTTDVASRMLDGAVKLPKQLFGGEVVGGAVDVNEVAQPAKGGRDLLRIFKELKQSVTNDWGGAKPPLVEEDKEFMDRKEKLQDIEHQLSNVSQQVEYLVQFVKLAALIENILPFVILCDIWNLILHCKFMSSIIACFFNS